MRALRDFLLAPPRGGAAPEAGAAPGFAAAAGPAAAGRAAAEAAAAGPAAPEAAAIEAAWGAAPASASRGGVARRWRSGGRADGATGGRGRTDAAGGLGAAVVPAAVAVLCAAEDARAVGVATAALLARRCPAPCGLACIWTAPVAHRHTEARPPASRGARRVAAVLEARGMDARACGRAAVVALPGDPDDAVRALARAGAAAGGAPVVLVLGGPRAAGFDDVLAGQDRLLVVARPGADPAIGALALAGLPPAGPPHDGCVLALGPLARALAAAGLATPAALRRSVDTASREGRR